MTNDYYQPINDSVQNPMADDVQADNTIPIADTAQPQTNITQGVAPVQQSVEEDAGLLVDKISEGIARDLGFADAPDEQKKKILDSINQRVETAVLKAIITNCPEETAKVIGEKIANETINPEEIEKVIKENPELQEKIEDEVGALYEKMLEESKQVWDGLAEKPKDDGQAPVSEPVKPEIQSEPNQASETVGSLTDKIKAAGIQIEHETVAQKIYEMRMNGEANADIELNDIPEVEHARRLSEWDWNKAGEIVKELNG